MKQARKYDPGVARENIARNKYLDELEAKKLYDIVCNHIAYPHLFGLSTEAKIDRLHVNKTPPKGMTGYIYICTDCLPYMENINQKTAKTCFSRMHESEFMKNIEAHERSKGILIR